MVHGTAHGLSRSGMAFEHDATGCWNGSLMLSRTIGGGGLRNAARVIRTAHEEQRVDGVFFGLLAGHAKNTRAWCGWSWRS